MESINGNGATESDWNPEIADKAKEILEDAVESKDLLLEQAKKLMAEIEEIKPKLFEEMKNIANLNQKIKETIDESERQNLIEERDRRAEVCKPWLAKWDEMTELSKKLD